MQGGAQAVQPYSFGSEEMANPKKTKQPSLATVATRLPLSLRERFAKILEGTELNTSEVLTAMVQIACDAIDEDPEALANAHLKIERERALGK
jgi:hypothetical protein